MFNAQKSDFIIKQNSRTCISQSKQNNIATWEGARHTTQQNSVLIKPNGINAVHFIHSKLFMTLISRTFLKILIPSSVKTKYKIPHATIHLSLGTHATHKSP